MSLRDGPNSPGQDAFSEEASYWWVLLNEPACSQSDREAFAKWVSRSPERIEAFLRMSMVSSALKSSDIKWSDISAEELIRQARESSALVIPLAQQASPAPHRPESVFWSRWRLASVTLLALLAVLITFWFVPHTTRYQTALGEQRSVLLEDGSIVTINTSSAIEVKYSRERRLVRLLRGEALFEVTHDVHRPFDVSVDKMVVRAVGTKFNVDRRAQRTTVSVVEGTVRVMAETPRATAAGGSAALRATMLSAAQRIVLTDKVVGMPEKIPDVSVMTAWTQRQLVFENRPLTQVAEEFNRYNRRQILIRAATLNEREITGVFQANDSYPFLVFIEQIPGVHVEVAENGDYVVTLKEDNGQS